MQVIRDAIVQKARALLADGTVNRVLGWQGGEFCYDTTPAVFTADTLDNLVYDCFCGANLSKYLIEESKKEGRILALLKPCDTYSFNQLVKEHRIDREKVYVLGVPSHGNVDMGKLAAKGIKGVLSAQEVDGMLKLETLYGDRECALKDVLIERCLCCKSEEFMVSDDTIADTQPFELRKHDRFAMVKKLEAMTPDERFAFWRGELSKCIRCNACRNACPACSCLKCIFDNDDSGVSAKANVDTFEENMFHIIRAFHVAGRCTDCGECSRVCPQGIPLHLLNRKFIKDINENYGDYQAGSDDESPWPLVSFTEGDTEPGQIKGGAQ